MKLLSLLHVRTTFAPHLWATFDTRECLNGWESGAFPTWFSAKCVKMEGENYGQLVDFDIALTHSWAIVGFPRAFQIITAQHELLLHLKLVVERIVGDSTGTGSKEWKALAQSGFAGAGQEAQWSPYINQAFTAPSQFSPHAMLDIARSKCGTVLDEIWLLKTDPAYMQAQIPARKADLSDNSVNLSTRHLYQDVGAILSTELYDRVMLWNEITACCQKVYGLFKAYGSQCGRGKVLPDEVSESFCALRDLLDRGLCKSSMLLEALVPTMRAFKGNYRLRRVHGTLKIEQEKELSAKVDADCLLYEIQGIGKILAMGWPQEGISHFFGMIEMRFPSGSATMRGLDARFMGHLSDMAALDEMLRSWTWSQHGVADCHELAIGMPPEIYQTRFLELSGSTKQVYASLPRNTMHDIGPSLSKARSFAVSKVDGQRFGSALQTFMDVPRPKDGMLGRLRLQKVIECRERLQDSWQIFRELFESCLSSVGPPKHQSLKDFLVLMKFDQSKEYLAEIEQERHAYETASADAVHAAESQDQLPSVVPQTTWGHSTADGPVCRKQTKAKAAKLAAANLEVVEHDLQELEIVPPHNTRDPELQSIAVKQDSLRILRKIYPQDGGASKGEVPWKVSLQTMADADFAITEASGSAVRFSNSHGRICFHRPHPHPDPVLDAVLLNAVAKRMQKWFGWHKDLFVERPRAVEESA